VWKIGNGLPGQRERFGGGIGNQLTPPLAVINALTGALQANTDRYKAAGNSESGFSFAAPVACCRAWAQNQVQRQH